MRDFEVYDNVQFKNQRTILIKSSKKKYNIKFIILIIISFFTLISSFISMSYSIKSYNNIKKEEVPTQVKQLKYLSIEYLTQNKIDIPVISKNLYLSKIISFSLSNEGNIPIQINVLINNIDTNVLSNYDLEYSIYKETDELIYKPLPLKDEYLISNIEILPLESIKYYLDIRYSGAYDNSKHPFFYNAEINVLEQNANDYLLN